MSGKVPPCLSGGPMINLALEAFVPKMDQQVESFVMGKFQVKLLIHCQILPDRVMGSISSLMTSVKR